MVAYTLLRSGIASECTQFCPILAVVFGIRVAGFEIVAVVGQARCLSPLTAIRLILVERCRSPSLGPLSKKSFSWVVVRSKSGPLMRCVSIGRECVDHHPNMLGRFLFSCRMPLHFPGSGTATQIGECGCKQFVHWSFPLFSPSGETFDSLGICWGKIRLYSRCCGCSQSSSTM